MVKMVRHTYTVTLDVPARSGDGWSKYPDHSADEYGRMLRRALPAWTWSLPYSGESFDIVSTVNHVTTEPIAND